MVDRRGWLQCSALHVVFFLLLVCCGCSDPEPGAENAAAVDRVTQGERLEDTPLQKLGRESFEPLIPEENEIGIVVGILKDGGEEVYAYGNPDFDGDTMFEIGSVTKVFTSLALGRMVGEGKVRLSDTLQSYLPDDVSAPAKDSKEIRLLHLATHTSGLPRMPQNFWVRTDRPFLMIVAGDPYAGYTVKKLHKGLSQSTLKTEPGGKYEYSNFGAALLGQALANAADSDYESLVRDSICMPLGMDSTMITLSAEAPSRMAKPYQSSGKPAANWTLDAMAGAGGLRSTVNDLFMFLRAHLDDDTEIGKAVKLALTERFKVNKNMSIGLGWHLKKGGDEEIWWHNGGTGGYASFVGFNRAAGVGVVVLGNANFHQELTKAGFEFLSAVLKTGQ